MRKPVFISWPSYNFRQSDRGRGRRKPEPAAAQGTSTSSAHGARSPRHCASVTRSGLASKPHYSALLRLRRSLHQSSAALDSSPAFATLISTPPKPLTAPWVQCSGRFSLQRLEQFRRGRKEYGMSVNVARIGRKVLQAGEVQRLPYLERHKRILGKVGM